jgi:hypothetical protein
MTKQTDHNPDPEQPNIEPAEVVWRRLARSKLVEQGFVGDVEAELDRLMRSGTGLRFADDFMNSIK